ncbi:MAG TPA: hypothetical protein VGB77_08790, partial [Abditibacteriaceae bacterium]
IQRQNLAFAIVLSSYMLFQLGSLLRDYWSGNSSVPITLVWVSLFCCGGAIITMPFSMLGFCTTYEIDEDGITQHTPCLAPVRVTWNEIEELRLRMFGLQIKAKNLRRPLRISVHLNGFNQLWKIIEEKSGYRAL